MYMNLTASVDSGFGLAWGKSSVLSVPGILQNGGQDHYKAHRHHLFAAVNS